MLIQANTNELWKYKDEKNKEKIRLETLLWGGDELIWVVPAWLGWYTLKLFFDEAAQKIEITPNNYPSESGKLSFAAGLVFCHHNAPIHRITKLAKTLADIAKKQDNYKNLVTYQVLESFDHAGTDIEGHRQKRLANLGNSSDLLIAADKMEELEKHFQTLKDKNFPRRKSYQIIKALLAGDADLDKSLRAKLVENSSVIEQTLSDLQALCGGNNAHWLHLIDLWDFIALEKKP